ncbi:quorum-sensing system DWW-type pheromone [Streptococcus hongkongensis]
MFKKYKYHFILILLAIIPLLAKVEHDWWHIG